VRISHVDEVERDDVVAGVREPGRGLVETVEVEAALSHSPQGQKLQRMINYNYIINYIDYSY